jgi:hypothetical protein
MKILNKFLNLLKSYLVSSREAYWYFFYKVLKKKNIMNIIQLEWINFLKITKIGV